ncbi:hypothetical protein DID75_03490 [Candidatus Marinamargulisbacteria bacterium SCGC AG-410-N11]|nr:hypothetical protein DID75_03490 [Candidatus Marinamargulisbacteria bacterium SCGC AG-410-N11]
MKKLVSVVKTNHKSAFKRLYNTNQKRARFDDSSVLNIRRLKRLRTPTPPPNSSKFSKFVSKIRPLHKKTKIIKKSPLTKARQPSPITLFVDRLDGFYISKPTDIIFFLNSVSLYQIHSSQLLADRLNLIPKEYFNELCKNFNILLSVSFSNLENLLSNSLQEFSGNVLDILLENSNHLMITPSLYFCEKLDIYRILLVFNRSILNISLTLPHYLPDNGHDTVFSFLKAIQQSRFHTKTNFDLFCTTNNHMPFLDYLQCHSQVR